MKGIIASSRGAVVAVGLALGFAVTGGSAQAAQGECAYELAAVGVAIDAATFLSKNADMDESNLLAKLEAAGAKVALDKYSDAVDKLEDISDKATALANAPKAKLDDATGINGAVAAAIACVGGVGG